jgi:membrane protein DedA with SNARE-associated domain
MTPQTVSDLTYRPPDTVGPTLAVLLGVVALLVAASYPVATATALTGALVGYLAGRFGRRGAARTRSGRSRDGVHA